MTDGARLFLDAWTHARPQPPARRAATLLARLGGEAEPERLPIGVRDRRLLELFAGMAGAHLAGVAECDSCGGAIEVAASVDMLMSGPPTAPILVEIDGERVPVRFPTTHDVLAAVAAPDPSRRLAELCAGKGELGAGEAEQVGAALLAADPLLDPQIAVTCPDCGAETVFGFDVGAFLWAKVEDRARHLLSQIHRLACAYGWTESEILKLPEARRAAYLELSAA
ncbi:hypothetical protein [Sphingosinicella sp. CPCC 101087]|uniref:hypothetical protein n=1 Tax=Sphingosinicella sp. CPCC 101087 TaxID=2497754 RepID=UPI00101D8BA6|nr:hypothetical protein [Sphingosinicella sp. CPCC 101087]